MKTGKKEKRMNVKNLLETAEDQRKGQDLA